jgi:tetratricopeptide (TPR) repeat protein
MNPCPDVDTLQSIVDGTLAEDEAAACADHLRACARCRHRLDQLSDDAEVRRWVAAARPLGAAAAEPRIAQVVAALCNTPVDAETTTVTNPASRHVLEPPRAPGDLGAIGPYRVLAEVGRGGMAIVLRGMDEALGRTVAIKVLRPELASPRMSVRLLHEAQAAARLQHDHVVRVYAVANTAEGLPYVVMEYLEGETLGERLQTRQPLTPEAAAAIVAQVADGLGAAHAVGLIHRDIKPSNLHIDRAGRVRILDFGLVRLLEQPTGATQEGTLAGTPAYMSPEQVQGASLDTRTDVYSLGVTLYEALTGELPFRGQPHLVFQQVLRGEPQSPRQFNDAIPRDLGTICLKAMAREPGRRYATAQAMADDLRRYLRGEPVRARLPGRLGRTWRWCRRNPRVALLSAALVFALVAGVSGIAWQGWQARREAERADAQRQLAEERLRDAEASLRESVGAVDALLTRVSEEKLLNQPHLQPLRRKLLEQALAHYRTFLKAHGDDPGLQSEAAMAAYRVASLIFIIGSGADAEAAWREAIARLEPVVTRDPAATAWRTKLSECHMSLGVAQQRGGNIDGALTSLESAAQQCELLLAAEPNNPVLRMNLVACYGNLANLQSGRGQAGAALAWYEKVHAILREMERADPTNRGVQRNLGLTLHNIAMMYLRPGDFAKAYALFDQARSIRQRLADTDPDKSLALRDLARTEQMLADACLHIGKAGAAPGHYQAAVDALGQVVEHHPANWQFRADFGQLCGNFGAFLANREQNEEALRWLEKGRSHYQQLLAADPKAVPALMDLARILHIMGGVQLHRRHAAEALPLLQDALKRRKQLLANHGNTAPQAEAVAVTARLYAEALFLLHRPAEARAALEDGLDHARRALNTAPTDAARRAEFVEYLQSCAQLLQSNGEPARAAELLLERARLSPL